MSEAASGGRRSTKPEFQLFVDWIWNALAGSSVRSRNALAQVSGYPKTFVYDVFDGRQFPTLEQARDLAQCLRCSSDSIEEIWHKVKAGRAAHGRTPGAWDPFLLGVHKSIEPADDDSESVLTDYVERQHDQVLRDLIGEPGHNVLAVVTGNACTGKTRTALESLKVCLPAWPLVCPIDSVELAELVASRSLQPQTVLWLDEMQVYLQGADGERAAAAVRRVLAKCESIVVIGTMWISHWDLLTSQDKASGDYLYPGAAQLLNSAVRINVPDSFSGDQEALALLETLSSGDSRLAAARAAAELDGKVTQVLAGGVELVNRYEHPHDEYGALAITAAMDIRRLGHYHPIPRRLLEKAVTNSLTPAQRVTSREWLADAIKFATTSVRGVRAVNPQRDTAGVGSADSYVLHDYLDQYARQTRWRFPGHIGLWQALAEHESSQDDRERLADEAGSRALFRLETILLRPLADAKNPKAIRNLAIRLFRAGHHDAAIELVQSGSSGSGDNLESLLMDFLKVDERWEDLLEVLKAKAERGSYDAIAEIGIIYEKAGELEGAARWLDRASPEGENNSTALRHMAKIEERNGRLQTAISLLRQGIAQSDCQAVRELMELLERHGRIAEAESVIYNEAIGCSCYDELAELGNLQIRAGVLHDRVEWWRNLMVQGDFHEQEMARHILIKFIKDPATCRESVAFYRKRIEDLRQIMSGRFTRDHLGLLDAQLNAGSAYELLDELTALAVDGDLSAMEAVADILLSMNRSREAEAWLNIANNKGSPTAWMKMAAFLNDSGRTEDAVGWLGSACLAGHNALENLVQLLRTVGRLADADRLWAFGLEPDGRIADPW